MNSVKPRQVVIAVKAIYNCSSFKINYN
ncbi:hypothetical protein XaC1_451 [Xanthomonas phage XaC1]|nr:hypothetical protein XaC1_451 [Xanthomonas phage XaC1]